MLELAKQKYPRMYQHMMDNLKFARRYRASEVTRNYWLDCAKQKFRILKREQEKLTSETGLFTQLPPLIES